MKKIKTFMEGNNIECLKTFRVNILLYNETSFGEPGQKYFFPDLAFFKDKVIVGIDVNLRTQTKFFPTVTSGGDLNTAVTNLGTQIGINNAKNVYCTIYDQDNSERFFSTPLRSFFMQPSTITTVGGTVKFPRRVKPYCSRINARKSYLLIPVGTIGFPTKSYVSLTFYYN